MSEVFDAVSQVAAIPEHKIATAAYIAGGFVVAARLVIERGPNFIASLETEVPEQTLVMGPCGPAGR